jgi:hypothetical protein
MVELDEGGGERRRARWAAWLIATLQKHPQPLRLDLFGGVEISNQRG